MFSTILGINGLLGRAWGLISWTYKRRLQPRAELRKFYLKNNAINTTIYVESVAEIRYTNPTGSVVSIESIEASQATLDSAFGHPSSVTHDSPQTVASNGMVIITMNARWRWNAPRAEAAKPYDDRVYARMMDIHKLLAGSDSIEVEIEVASAAANDRPYACTLKGTLDLTAAQTALYEHLSREHRQCKSLAEGNPHSKGAQSAYAQTLALVKLYPN